MSLIKNRWLSVAGALAGVFFVGQAFAASQYVRVIWDANPAQQAVIGFSPDGISNSPYVRYGASTNEQNWQQRSVDQTARFDGSLTSHFVRLSGLSADSEVYFRICDQGGCGQRYYFRTAPTDNSPYTFVAGGDTRTGWTNRRQGNALIAKLRPLFIMHGGDFTDANNAYQMRAFLSDWELTHTADEIDGLAYERVYPLIPTHGNHEDNDYSTLCRVFGVDADNNGQCNPSDTYNAFNVSPLLRVYTLNSQFKDSGWSSYASAMNNWLDNDLANFSDTTTWRVAQYHKPMFPHYTGKSENQILFNWWANAFYSHSMNLVVESDTHMTKVTQALVPSGSNFSATNSGGTVYVGEGSWGAPARSANDPKSWTIDLASIQQFKVIQVEPGQMAVRTAQFASSANMLSRSARAADPLALPANVQWWSANQIGEVMNLSQSGAGRSVIESDGGGNEGWVNLAVSDDAFIARSQASTNFDGDADGLLADGSDSSYGEMHSLIRFDLAAVPACVENVQLELDLNITNPSSGSYDIFLASSDWQESSVSWNSVGGDAIKGAKIGDFTPDSVSLQSIDLTGSGALQQWLSNGNLGLVIASAGTNNGVDISSKETGPAPVLWASFDAASDCGGGDGNDGGDSGSNDWSSVAVSDDTFVASNQAARNFDGDADGLLADGSDSSYGRMHSLIKFNLSGLPACVDNVEAELQLTITNPSSGRYDVFLASGDWSEESATWNAVGGDAIQGAKLADFVPTSTGQQSISLTGSGALQSWLADGNTGLVIVSGGTSNGVDIASKETGAAPVLWLRYAEGTDCGGDDNDNGPVLPYPQLSNGQVLNNVSPKAGEMLLYYVNLPSGVGQFDVTISGGSGDADLYVRQGAEPSLSQYDCRPWRWGNAESCGFSNPAADTWFIGVNGYYDSSNITLEVVW